MKKQELSKLAFLGIASALVLAGQGNVEGTQNEEIQYLAADHKCKGAKGCGGIVADRDNHFSSSQDDEQNDETADNEDDSKEEETDFETQPNTPKTTQSPSTQSMKPNKG